MNEKKEFYFISFKEDLILKKYYKRSIETSIYWWDNNKIKKFEALINKNKSYKSPVSNDLFTRFSEKTMWVSIFVLISSLVLINLMLPFIKKSNSY